jgi:hypothetical protein
MTIEELLKDKSKKTKEKVETISNWLLNASLPTDELLAFAEKAKETDKATCIESLEFATKQNPTVADESVFKFVTKTLTDSSPRVKWESAKVIGNTAHLFPEELTKAIKNLLANSSYDGTVVRWAAAFALAEVLKLKTKHNKTLLPAIEALAEREENNGVKKKYLDALKKVKK